MNPKYSIIIPAHNAEDCIRTCLDSVVSQNYKNYELIVVCDACTDNTADTVRRYGVEPIITNHHRDGLARNAGLDVARGEWVLFLDADDWWLHEYVLDQLNHSLDPMWDILFFSFIWKGQGYFTQGPKKHYVAVWNKCWRREFIGDTRFTDVYGISDMYFDKAMMAKGPKCAYWDMPFYYYNYLYEGSINWKRVTGEQ